MGRPQHPMLALGGLHKHQAHEGRLIELEATHAFSVQERLKPLLTLSLRDSAPIEPLDGNLDSLDHLLHGLRDTLPAEAAAQNRMPLGDPLPGAKELRFVQWLVQRCDHLLYVSVGISSAEAVEQHPRLHRGQFVRIDYRSHGASPGPADQRISVAVSATDATLRAKTRSMSPVFRYSRPRWIRPNASLILSIICCSVLLLDITPIFHSSRPSDTVRPTRRCATISNPHRSRRAASVRSV